MPPLVLRYSADIRLAYQPWDMTLLSRKYLEAEGYKIESNARIVVVNLDNFKWKESQLNLIEEGHDNDEIFHYWYNEMGEREKLGNIKNQNKKDSILEGEVELTMGLRKRLGVQTAAGKMQTKVAFLFLRPIRFSEVGVQQVTKILKKRVLVDSEKIDRMYKGFKEYGFTHMQTGVRCQAT